MQAIESQKPQLILEIEQMLKFSDKRILNKYYLFDSICCPDNKLIFSCGSLPTIKNMYVAFVGVDGCEHRVRQ